MEEVIVFVVLMLIMNFILRKIEGNFFDGYGIYWVYYSNREL